MEFEKSKSCCFTGHREIASGTENYLFGRIKDGILYLYEHGIKFFLTGGAIGFDTLAAQAVLDYKKRYEDIRLIVVTPCQDQAKKWRREDVEMYEYIKKCADDVICLSEHYYGGCMQKRNRYLVDHSCVCICYLTKEDGGTAYTVKYAKSRGLKTFNLARNAHVR